MNYWTKLSEDFANQRNYLDELFRVYPTIPEGIREVDQAVWINIEKAFINKNDIDLMKSLLSLDLFPIKDSYIAYLKRDKKAIERNPLTIKRLCGRLYEMGLDDIYLKCSEAKETNRQIGPMFQRWFTSGAIGLESMKLSAFSSTNNNGILDASDGELMTFAQKELNYKHAKGLDFICRINGKYIIGEAKFLTDFGGHQNAQFNDAISVVSQKNINAVLVAVLDGVLYIVTVQRSYN